MKPVSESMTRTLVTAAVTFFLLGLWVGTVVGVFNLVKNGTKIDPVTLTVLGGVIGTTQTLLVGAVSYWIGTTAGAKSSGDALAQLAGAGPSPPAQPLKDQNNDVSVGTVESKAAGGSSAGVGKGGQSGDLNNPG